MRHRQPKGSETDRPVLNHRVTSRLYTFGVVTPKRIRANESLSGLSSRVQRRTPWMASKLSSRPITSDILS